jgi:hypothetical protein
MTADEKLDTAATVLRMLYIKDLRKLQTQIDEMIVQVQVSTPHHCLGDTTLPTSYIKARSHQQDTTLQQKC